MVEAEALVQFATFQMGERQVPAQVAAEGALGRIVREPGPEESDCRVAFPGLVVEMGQRMGGIRQGSSRTTLS